MQQQPRQVWPACQLSTRPASSARTCHVINLLQHVQLHTEVQHIAPVRAARNGSTDGSSNCSTDASASARAGSPAPPLEWLRWEVTTTPTGSSQQRPFTAASSSTAEASSSGSSTTQYDAVVVCNGHYSRPRLPQIAGQDTFPGLVMHSHNYRRPDGFK